MRRWRDGREHLDVRETIGTRDRVVGKRAGQQLSVVVVHRLFPERLTDSLDHTSVHLSFDDHRVDLRAAVIHRDVASQAHVSRLRFDVDDGDVRAEWKGKVRRIVEARRLEARLHALRQVPRHVGEERDVLDRLVTIRRTLHEELAVGVVHVFDCRLEKVAREQFRLVLDLARRHGQRSAADRGGAAAVGAPSHRGVVRVTVDNLDVVHTHAELVGHHLRERRLFSLPVWGRTDEHVHFAARVKPDDGAFPEATLEADRAGDL